VIRISAAGWDGEKRKGIKTERCKLAILPKY
jgi:hypothetical protein